MISKKNHVSLLISSFIARKAATRAKSRRKTESSDEDEIDGVEAKTPAPRSQKARGAKKKPILSFSDEEDSDIELFEVDKTSKKKKGETERNICVYSQR